MLREEQVRLLRGLISHLDAGTNVDAKGIVENPADTYTSEERFSEEKNKFFEEYPQIIGMSGDLPESGSFLTIEDFGAPILATRDETGAFKAFANVCAHRAVIVENDKKGLKSKFSCPFHGWTYDNKGKLIGFPKPDHFGHIDKSCYGLKELPSVEKYGFLWVHPNPKGVIDVNALLGPKLMEELDSWGFGDLKLEEETEYVTDMNWKLAIDTFGESYHFSTLHKNSLFESFHGNVQMFDTFKRNSRITLCKRDIDSMKEEPEEDWHICKGAFPVYFLFPNIILNVSNFGIILVRQYPLEDSPHKSVSKVSFYYRSDVLKELERLGVPVEEIGSEGFGSVIRDEDYVVAAASHKGMRSGLIDKITFGRNEPALHHYHNTFREALDYQKLPLIEL